MYFGNWSVCQLQTSSSAYWQICTRSLYHRLRHNPSLMAQQHCTSTGVYKLQLSVNKDFAHLKAAEVQNTCFFPACLWDCVREGTFSPSSGLQCNPLCNSQAVSYSPLFDRQLLIADLNYTFTSKDTNFSMFKLLVSRWHPWILNTDW